MVRPASPSGNQNRLFALFLSAFRRSSQFFNASGSGIIAS
jgi:hypothetical protein